MIAAICKDITTWIYICTKIHNSIYIYILTYVHPFIHANIFTLRLTLLFNTNCNASNFSALHYPLFPCTSWQLRFLRPFLPAKSKILNFTRNYVIFTVYTYLSMVFGWSSCAFNFDRAIKWTIFTIVWRIAASWLLRFPIVSLKFLRNMILKW